MRMFKKIMDTTLFVSDQDKALDFYTQMFGFEKRADNLVPRVAL
jgi:catechol 2,3-dioxygenase-like lactoylglutathione lyase family enzyme